MDIKMSKNFQIQRGISEEKNHVFSLNYVGFLHLLSHFDKKKIEKHLPKPGFEPATLYLIGECNNH